MRRKPPSAEIGRVIEAFKSNAHPEESIISLAGTGPNGAAHVRVLRALTIYHLARCKRLNVVSGSAFSLMIYLAHTWGCLNYDALFDYDARIRHLHGMSCLRTLRHVARGNVRSRSLYQNQQIGDTIHMLFGSSFADKTLAEIALPLTLFAYCQHRGTLVEINRETFPSFTFADMGRASVAIPFIHGPFLYRNYSLIDPIFSPALKDLRHRLLKQRETHLYVNHKKTAVIGKIHFVGTEERSFPELAMAMDFVKFYFGLPNRHVEKTNYHAIKGVI